MSGTNVRAVVWVGRLPTDPTRAWSGCAVVLDRSGDAWTDDDDEVDHFLTAFDYGVGLPDSVGFYVWEAQVEWYDDRGSIPDGECGCRVYRQSWRPARALEVWQAQANAKARGVTS